MNNTFSNAVGTIKGLNHFGSECIHSIVWYRFIFIAALVYYTMALLSMIFAKESRRLRRISTLHDNLVVFIVLPSSLEWFGFTLENSTVVFAIRLFSHHKTHAVTCSTIVFLHSSLQASFVVGLVYVIYAERVLLPQMTSMKPRTVCNLRFICLQVAIGLTITTATTVMDSSHREKSTNRCCLDAVHSRNFSNIVDLTFSLSCIYAIFILLRVSIDRFLKLIVTTNQRPSLKIYARQVLL